MKPFWFLLPGLAALLLTGCISGERMVRNSPFYDGNFSQDGVNLWPLYYQEGANRSILFPLIDIDDRGFAVRPFYHRDNDEHGILWPLCAFNPRAGWIGTYFWCDKGFGLLPLFTHDDELTWIFPASWYNKKRNEFAILPLFWHNEHFLWIGNFLKTDDMFLVLPVYGSGENWFYCLNFICFRDNECQVESYCLLPLAFYRTDRSEKTLLTPLAIYDATSSGKMFLTPLFSIGTDKENDLRMLNLAMLLYHYSHGRHYIFYPIADVDIRDDSKQVWLWPLFHYGERARNHFPLFLFDYESFSKKTPEGTPDNYSIRILYPLLFEHEYHNDGTAETALLPGGLLWKSRVTDTGYDHRILGGAFFRSSEDKTSRHFSLLYKFFSYRRFNDDVKWEFFPFVKILETAQGGNWSFCWRLLEKHDGGGYIFFIPYGKPQTESSGAGDR